MVFSSGEPLIDYQYFPIWRCDENRLLISSLRTPCLSILFHRFRLHINRYIAKHTTPRHATGFQAGFVESLTKIVIRNMEPGTCKELSWRGFLHTQILRTSFFWAWSCPVKDLRKKKLNCFIWECSIGRVHSIFHNSFPDIENYRKVNLKREKMCCLATVYGVISYLNTWILTD